MGGIMKNNELNNDYKVAAYLRLSREDLDKNSNNSQFIENQKSIILKYISENMLNLIDIYIDDRIFGN